MQHRHILELQKIDLNKIKPKISLEKTIHIIEDDIGVAIHLKKTLENTGYKVKVAKEFNYPCDVLISLQALQEFQNEDQAIQNQKTIFLTAKQHAKYFQEYGGAFIIVINTGGNLSFNNSHKLQAWNSGLSGLVKTALHEWQKAKCRVIDIAFVKGKVEEISHKLADEIIYGGEVEVGITLNQRVTLQAHPQNIIKQSIPLKENDVILVTGGARGITASCIIELAKSLKLRFILLGRSEITQELESYSNIENEKELKKAIFEFYANNKIKLTPKEIQEKYSSIIANREINSTITLLKKAGSEVQYLSLDICKFGELQRNIDAIRQKWKSISALIHGAGVLADKLIAEKTIEQFDKVFDTKVIGLKNLLKVTENDPLKLLVLFSSVAGRFGNVGQSDYAMANETLNKVAHQQQLLLGNSCLVKAINWGPWENGMVTPQLKEMFEQRGIKPISIQNGTQYFIDEICDSSHNNIEVIIGDQIIQEEIFNHLEINVSKETHPYLLSHIIENDPVLPACIALEWFMKTAKKLFKENEKLICKNFRLMKGIILSDFNNTVHRFHVDVRENNNYFTMRLLGNNNTLHYQAEIHCSENHKNEIQFLQNENIYAWPWEVTDIYLQENSKKKHLHLFHGCDFQMLDALDKVSDYGGAGIIKSLQMMNWRGDWCTDAIVLDGVFQLIRLWGVRMTTHSSLPTKISEYHQYKNELPKGKLKCIFKSSYQGMYRSVSDAILLDENNEIFAHIKGIEMCRSKV